MPLRGVPPWARSSCPRRCSLLHEIGAVSYTHLRGEEVLRSRESSAGLSLLQARGDDGHLVDLLGVAAAGEVVDGGVEAQELSLIHIYGGPLPPGGGAGGHGLKFGENG